jgi:hypothetical protein
VDELFLALAPLIAGRLEPSLVEGGPLPEPIRLRLLNLLKGDDFLFARYAVGA